MHTTTASPTTKEKSSVAQNGLDKKRAARPQTRYSVLETTDYDIFKIMANNRVLNLLHVHRLKESFTDNDFLVNPILVNEKYEVIDGQHRLRAAKEADKPVYYIVVPGYGIKEVQVLNTHQKNWTKEDFLTMYCAEGIKPYIQFRDFMMDFPQISFLGAERILTGRHMKGGREVKKGGLRIHVKDFQEGRLNIPDLNRSKTEARKVMDFEPFFPGDFGQPTFVSAIIPLFKSKNYNHKEMLHKLSTCPIKLQPARNLAQYREQLETIFNYKRQKENKVSFKYE